MRSVRRGFRGWILDAAVSQGGPDRVGLEASAAESTGKPRRRGGAGSGSHRLLQDHDRGLQFVVHFGITDRLDRPIDDVGWDFATGEP